MIADLDQVELWWRALDGEESWREALDGFACTVDWPGGYFYRELVEAYPDAKVLLSVRDPEPWERSFRDTIWEMGYGQSLMPLLARARAEVDPKWRRYLALVERMFWGPQGTFADGHEAPEQLIEQMQRHNESVKQLVPAERLLVWEVGEGWEPLCAFLGVDVPDSPLPHANDRETFLERVIDGALGAIGAWRAAQAQPQPQPQAAS